MMRHRIAYVLLAALLSALAGTAAAQEIVRVRVSTEPEGAQFMVDGQIYTRAMTFEWRNGSKHIVSIPTAQYIEAAGAAICGETSDLQNTQFDSLCRVRYGFTGWEADRDLATSRNLTQAVVAGPGLTFLKANLQLEYRVDIAMPAPPPMGSTAASCAEKARYPATPRPSSEGIGVVFIGGRCIDFGGSVWLPPGEVALQAIPLAGYAFNGWQLGTGPVQGALTSYTVRGPGVLAPRFVLAKRVRVLTDPVGLKVRVDGMDVFTSDPDEWLGTYPIPGYFDWAPGSKHVLGAPESQTDVTRNGRMWVFHSWSNGGGQNMPYVADAQTNKPETLLAKFVPGVSVLFLTEPRGLRLNVEGRDDWPQFTFVWGLGSKHAFSAPAEQVDRSGRRWLFKGWKHGGPAAQTLEIDDAAIAAGGVYRTAVYESTPRVVFETSAPGIMFRVNGSDCVTPCSIDAPAGTRVHVAAPAVAAVSDSVRHEFLGWADAAEAERTVTIAQEFETYRANYRTMHRLAAATDPANGGTVMTDPPSPDGFYPAGASVAIRIAPHRGFKLRRWEGDLGGVSEGGTLSMGHPRSVLAVMDRIPELASTSVINAAGPTPVEGVAPGSLITILGASLAAAPEAGPANPLAQTLGGVAVMLGNRIIGLTYVSPEQINALLPSDVLPGKHPFTVRSQSGAIVRGEFEVVPNAPGLFSNLFDSKPYAAAVREDGSLLSPANPARPEEVVTLLGTGFGPYNRPVVDGFPIPAEPRYDLLEPVELFLAGEPVKTEWAGAAPGYNGVTAVRFRIPAEVAGERELWVSIAGAESNRVVLPVE